MNDQDSIDIASSDLGTKDFWDDRYNVELANFKEFGDEGEIWFGTSSEKRIVQFLITTNCSREAIILDLGCGNGSVLRKLRFKGFKNLIGIDYCDKAVQLAKSISAEEKKEDESIPDIVFQQLDITEPEPDFLTKKFNVVLDKGTWDAMSLSDDRETRLSSYHRMLSKTLANDGLFIIFSCNFTADELRKQFSSEELTFEKEVPALHSISFGGKQGVTSTGAVFRKMI